MVRRLLVALASSSLVFAASTTLAAEKLDEAEATRRVCVEGAHSELAAAMRLRGEAATTAAAVLPNPTLVAEHQRALDGTTEQETILGVAVPLGIGGRRGLLRDAAQAQRKRAISSANAALFEAALTFRRAYQEAAFESLRFRALSQQQVGIEALSETIRRLTERGETAGYDLSRQQLQARLHQNAVESARSSALAALAYVEAFLGVQLELPASLPDEQTFREAVRRAARTSSDGRHPRVLDLRADARASEAAARAARRRWVPDIELFAGYRGTRVGSASGDGIALGVEVPLTFFDHGQGEAALAEAEQHVALATAKAVRNEQQAHVAAAWARFRVLESSTAALARASVDAKAIQERAARLYGAGETSLADVFEVFRNAEEAELRRIELGRELAEARLAIMRWTGTFFDPVLDGACGAGTHR